MASFGTENTLQDVEEAKQEREDEERGDAMKGNSPLS